MLGSGVGVTLCCREYVEFVGVGEGGVSSVSASEETSHSIELNMIGGEGDIVPLMLRSKCVMEVHGKVFMVSKESHLCLGTN